MILAAIFIIFLLQIFTRYAPKIAWLMPIPPIHDWMMALEPIGWTVNLISLLWVWLIFFGCAFFVRESDHVAFDVSMSHGLSMPPAYIREDLGASRRMLPANRNPTSPLGVGGLGRFIFQHASSLPLRGRAYHYTI